MAYTDYFDEVQSIYIAYYQRPADPAGLRYWAQRLNAEGGNLDAIIDAFSNSPEAKSLYTETDPLKLVDSVYQALFGRPADNGADNFYVKALEAGKFPDGRPATLGRVAIDVLNGAQGDDRVAIDNKLTVANDFTQIVDGRPLTDPEFGFDGLAVTYEGDDDAAAAREFLKGVKSDPSTVPTQDGVKAVVAEKIADPTDAPVETGQTFTLTVNPDTATANVFEAPSVVTQVGALLDTLQSTDKLTGTGTNPTLNVTLSSTITSTPQLTGIETINVMPEVAAQTLNLSKATGLKAINIDSSQQDMTILGVQSNVTVGVSNGDGTADTLVRFADSVTSGGADVAKVVLTNNGNPTVASGQVINLSGTTSGGFETLEITANGTNRINEILSDVAAGIGVAATATNSVRTVKVAGDGSLRIDTALNSTTTFDATGNKGGVNVTLNNAGNISVKGGDGNDTFDLQATLTNNDTVDGGGGRDTLAVSAGTGLGVGNKVSNIEILRVNGAASFTFDNDDLTTVDAIVHNSAGAMTYQDMAVAAAADSAKGLTILNNGAVTYNLKGVGGLGATDQGLYVKIGSDTVASALQTPVGVNTGAITTDASSLTLDVKAFGGQTALGTGAITAANAATVTIKGGAPGEAFTVSTGAAFGTPGTLTKIDAGSFSGDLTVSGNAGAQAIIGGTGGDSLATGGRGAATTLGDLLHGGAGNDTFVFAAADSTAAIPNAGVAGAFTAAQKALFTQIDDLNLGGATAATAADALNLGAVSAGITNTGLGNHVAVVNGGAATALSGADFGTAVGALLAAGTGLLQTAATAVGNSAAAGLFTWGGETFLIATDGAAAGYTAGDDIVINVTGVTGTLDSSDFV